MHVKYYFKEAIGFTRLSDSRHKKRLRNPAVNQMNCSFFPQIHSILYFTYKSTVGAVAQTDHTYVFAHIIPFCLERFAVIPYLLQTPPQSSELKSKASVKPEKITSRNTTVPWLCFSMCDKISTLMPSLLHGSFCLQILFLF